ncbi:putative ABC transport system permease protein [Evansella vedderi]|uniref:ABC transport system permease protein n=1 Tax=Evansella vedderi TaxID=38282 RepID=A0ABT9ZTT0_9BACI|nr:ABC transporter permease [Evansella vedderi]MDQ0253570.1 putative ABC transport system permease protein [Evansella vedderi]
MNIVNKLTLRHLKENKRRTLVTIIGTIISVAMITAVSTLVVSFFDLMQRHEIAQSGEWHVQYHGVDQEQVETIQNDKNTKDVILSNDRGYAYLEGSENQYKPYLFIRQYDENGFEHFPITLSEGRFPEKENEIVISEEIANNANIHYEIGEELTLDVGDRYGTGEYTQQLNQTYSLMHTDGEIAETLENVTTETYTIVGTVERPTWEPSWAPGYTIVGYLDKDRLVEGDTVRVSVVLNSIHRNLFTDAEALAQAMGLTDESVQYNTSLLRYYGVTNDDRLRATLYSLSTIIISIIIVGSVALIYNAFAISVSERSRHLGMLSSVGATKRQKRNSVFFEGTVIGAISIPIGILAGIGGIGITFYFINRFIEDALGISERFMLTVTSGSIIVACFVSILTIFISTYIPAKRASKISAIDAIRQTADIKLTRKGVKTTKLVRKVFGIEGELGLKNLKRNKRKYKVTVFSLVVSIVLFLTVSFFTYSLEKSVELSSQGVNYDIQVYAGGKLTSKDEGIVNSITQLQDVTDFSRVKETQLNSWIEEQQINKILKENLQYNPEILKDDKYPYYISIHGLDEDSLREYASEVGVDPEAYFHTEEKMAIIVDTIQYHDWESGRYIETKAIHANVGETLELFYENWETNESVFVNEVEIGLLTDVVPMGIFTANLGGLNVIVSDNVFVELVRTEERIHYNNYIYLNSSKPLDTQYQIEELKTNQMTVYNHHRARQQDRQMMMLMSVFIYGFIVLITAISIANIFNTISTSISLRKREFAMLKSVGMTPKSFMKMINYESIFYGVKSLLYGLPISIGIMYLFYRSMMHTFSYQFEIPWISIIYVIVAVFIIVAAAMLYSTSKVRKENIIETLKQENI